MATAVALTLAQTSTALAETTTSPPAVEGAWLNWVLLVAFGALCCGVAFKNPKRTHQS